MIFNVGDKVKFLNTSGNGIVTRIEKNTIFVDSDGFELPMKETDLVADIPWGQTPKVATTISAKQPVEKPINHKPSDLSDLTIEEQKAKLATAPVINKEAPAEVVHHQRKQPLINRYKTNHREAEVDMHIWELTDTHRNLTPGECFNIQISFFRECLESAIEENYTKIIFIHGVGNGILKTEIRKILDDYDYIEYFNASMAKYGVGATEVNIRHNK